MKKLLKDLNPNKAPGPDGISPRLLKELSSELAPAFTVLFRSSLTTGVVPADWRTANVSPVFKKGERYLPENYRLTSIPCKLLEHILVSGILTFAEENDILCASQHGFRRNRSCESQLIGLVDELSDDLENGKQVDILVMDFAKAFDRVCHSLLVHKLSHYGIVGQVNTWIRNFLANRQQVVVVDGATSGSIAVESGVPQGSVLGPCLFLLYINDLPEDLTSTARLFADDTLCHNTVKSSKDQQDLQEDLNHLAEWEQKWQMKFHPSKCQSLQFTRKRQRLPATYTLHGHTLSNEKEVKYLGVTLSDNMKWGPHITKVVKKANKSLGFLRRNLRVQSQRLKERAYKALVRPTLEYASSVWDPHNTEDITKLEAVQRRAARWVVNRHRQTSSVASMLHDLKWPSLQSRW